MLSFYFSLLPHLLVAVQLVRNFFFFFFKGKCYGWFVLLQYFLSLFSVKMFAGVQLAALFNRHYWLQLLLNVFLGCCYVGRDFDLKIEYCMTV